MAIDRTNRERAIRTADAAVKRIQAGISFGVFVEGTRAMPGELLPFKKGAFYMAKQAGVPIVPIAIRHSDELMGKGTGTAKSGTIKMIILKPEDTSNFTEHDINDLIAKTRAAIAGELGIRISSRDEARVMGSRR